MSWTSKLKIFLFQIISEDLSVYSSFIKTDLFLASISIASRNISRCKYEFEKERNLKKEKNN